MPWYVNGALLDDEQVREEARAMRPQYMESITDMDPIAAEMQLKEWARENVIERMLLKQAASADPEPVPEEVIERGLEAAQSDAGGLVGCGTRNSDAEVREQIAAEYRLQRLLNKVQASVPRPSEKEIATYYKTNREIFRTPELCRARHIVKNIDETHDEASARKAIEEAEAELKTGVPFEQVADKYSDCAGSGGDLGWFPRGEMVDEFEAEVFRLRVGATSGIFRSVFGLHIARVEGRKPEGIRPLADVREQIVEALTAERRQQALESYLDSLRAQAEIRQSKAAK